AVLGDQGRLRGRYRHAHALRGRHRHDRPGRGVAARAPRLHRGPGPRVRPRRVPEEHGRLRRPGRRLRVRRRLPPLPDGLRPYGYAQLASAWPRAPSLLARASASGILIPGSCLIISATAPGRTPIAAATIDEMRTTLPAEPCKA